MFACEDTSFENKDHSERFQNTQGRVKIVIDKETNCKYIRETYGQGVSMTALLKSNGMPDCDKRK